jgi:uncharacterized membrane protein (DUF106 family)
MTSEFSFVLQFLDSIFLQNDFFGIRKGPLGSADPIIKGMLPSALGILGISILLNLFNAGVRRKLVDRDKLKRITKETRAWQKERMAAFRSKDKEKIADVNKKSSYMNKLSMEMMQMNMRPMMITIIPLLLIFYFVLPQMFAYTVAISPIPLDVIPGNFFQLTCTAEKVDGVICKHVNELYFWAWYFLTSISFSGIIMKLTKTSMDIG